jgi:hypothetical protein
MALDRAIKDVLWLPELGGGRILSRSDRWSDDKTLRLWNPHNSFPVSRITLDFSPEVVMIANRDDARVAAFCGGRPLILKLR